MEAKEIIEIIMCILANIGLIACIIAASYGTYSMIVIDRQIKRDLKRIKDELAKTEKEE